MVFEKHAYRIPAISVEDGQRDGCSDAHGMANGVDENTPQVRRSRHARAKIHVATVMGLCYAPSSLRPNRPPMGTESSVLIVGNGQRIVWGCASDGQLDSCLSALAASVAAYGLDTFRQALADLQTLTPEALAADGDPTPVEERFGEYTGFIYADLPALIDRAVAVAQARGQAPFGLANALWGFDRRVPRFSLGGLVGLLTHHLVVPTSEEVPRTTTLNLDTGAVWEGEGFPFIVDLDRGVLLALDHEETGSVTYRLDLTTLEGWDAEQLEGQLYRLVDACFDPDAQAALQKELGTSAIEHTLLQAGLDATARGQVLASLGTGPRLHGPSQHFIWSIYWDDRDGFKAAFPQVKPATTLVRSATDAEVIYQVDGAIRAMISEGMLPETTLAHIEHTFTQDGHHWFLLDQAPMTSVAAWRVRVLGEALWQYQQVQTLTPMVSGGAGVKAGKGHILSEITPTDTISEAAFCDAFRQDQRTANPQVGSDATALDELGIRATDALYALDASAWLDLPGDALTAQVTQDDWRALLDELVQALDRTILVLTPILHAAVATFLQAVGEHALFQQVTSRLSLQAQARWLYLLRHPLPLRS